MSHSEIWTDGSCLGNPGPGGWAFLIKSTAGEVEQSGGEVHTTNNRMELFAAISALEALAPGSQVRLFADSQYVKDGITKWIHGWKRKGWQTSTKQPVKNEDLWRRLDAAIRHHTIEWRWTKGHAADAMNNRVDRSARAAAETFRG